MIASTPVALCFLDVSIPTSSNTNLLMMLRWIHFIAGITWVGLLYYFNLANIPFLRETDPATRSKVMTGLVPRALWWFRWASVVTVLSGLWYWMIIVGTDKRNALSAGIDASGGRAIGTFFVLWTLAFVVYMGAIMSPAARSGAVIGIVAAVAVIAAAWLFVSLNQHGWESNRLLAIGVGGGLGWFMMFNVWGLLWRAQKKMIRWTGEGNTDTPEFAKNARWSYLASRTNFVLSFPMLFFMAAASHYPIFVH